MAQFSDPFSALIKKFSPAKVVRSSVGLDIGVGSCRMIEVVNRADGYELVRWAIEPVVAGDVIKSIRTVMSKVSQPNISPVTALTGREH